MQLKNLQNCEFKKKKKNPCSRVDFGNAVILFFHVVIKADWSRQEVAAALHVNMFPLAVRLNVYERLRRPSLT